MSRNLLAHLRRLAEERDGRLPEALPALPHTRQTMEGETVAPIATGLAEGNDVDTVLRSNSAYFAALAAHLCHHADGDLLTAHLPAVRLCAERLILLRLENTQNSGGWKDRKHAAPCAEALRGAAQLAQAAANEVDAARWESEAAYLAQLAGAGDTAREMGQGSANTPDKTPESWLASVQMAGAAVWEGCGMGYRDGGLWVEPTWPSGSTWWALLGLPLANGKHLSLLWDGSTLHATQPVRSNLPVEMYKRIQIHRTDEFDFDPYFELTRDSHAGDTATTDRFKPKFLPAN